MGIGEDRFAVFTDPHTLTKNLGGGLGEPFLKGSPNSYIFSI